VKCLFKNVYEYVEVKILKKYILTHNDVNITFANFGILSPALIKEGVSSLILSQLQIFDSVFLHCFWNIIIYIKYQVSHRNHFSAITYA